MKKFPNNLHNLFRKSTINSVEIIKEFQPDYEKESLDFSNMFQDCIQLTSIDFSRFNFCIVGKFNHMFKGCKNLEFFTLPKNISVNCDSIENADFTEMFSDCSSLTSIDLSDISFNGINNIEGLFFKCESIESIKLKGTLTFQELPQSIYLSFIQLYINPQEIHIDIFPTKNVLKNLNLFELNMNLSFIDLNNLNSLEECLYNQYYQNIKKCSKYMGFHYCGDCYNDNPEYYCTKIIDGKEFKFYYLEGQENKIYKERECYWSDNFNNFLSYKFVNNGENEISYFTLNYESCELYLSGTSKCLKCNYDNGYYKIENVNFICSNETPAENYVLADNANEWRKCNPRCRRCSKESNFEINHQCLNCSEFHYPFKKKYEDYQNGKISGFNCYTDDEFKYKYLNYFKNSDNQFEKCDISCRECSEKKKCINCNYNYYSIFENENGTCFHEPLENYGLISINSKIFFKQCFHLCKFCNLITQSFLFQQCTKCKLNYTLDIYSLNQSFCIPEDISNSSFIKEKTKWYIENIDIDDIKEIENNYEILNDEKYSNITFKIVKDCPDDKPYIIYSIRQCVSSCNSSNAIEKGIFMRKKLYLYNDICYDECPYGSIKDDINDTCIEINQYTSINTSLNANLFKENNDKYILKYLSEYANNSVDIIRAHDFSNFFYNQTTNYSYRLELKLPIFNFSECIEKIKYHYNLYNYNIFFEIIEYNDQTNKNGKYNKNSNLINSTEYKFFLENGTISHYSICQGINITIEKRVEMNKVDINEIKEIQSKYNVSIFDNNNEQFNDYCIPFSIGNKDMTLYDRKLLINKYKPPCDEGCNFLSFNYSTNYSTCICPIKIYDEKKIMDKIIEEINENDNIKLLKNSNLKYFKCYKAIVKINIGSLNWLIIISLICLISHIIISISLLKNQCNRLKFKHNKVKENKDVQREYIFCKEINFIVEKKYEKIEKNSNNKNIINESLSIQKDRNLIDNIINKESDKSLEIKSENNNSNNSIIKYKIKKALHDNSEKVNSLETFKMPNNNKKKRAKKEKKLEESQIRIKNNEKENSSKKKKLKFSLIFKDYYFKYALNFIKENNANQSKTSINRILIPIYLHSFLFINAIFFQINL